MSEEEFYQKIPQWIGYDRSSWNHLTIFAYFCHKYEKKTGVRFKMVRSKSGPTCTKESRDFAKLVKLFCPDNLDDLDPAQQKEKKIFAINKTYNYINWMFDYKHRNAPAVSGSQIFLVPSMLNEFERMYEAHLKSKASQNSIESLHAWIKKDCPSGLDRFQLESKDDIALFCKWAESSNTKDRVAISILEKIKEMKLNEK